jgi:hypothetical protein
MSQGIVPLALRLRACLWRGWQIGTPAHVVVKKDSRVEILAGKVLVTWEEGKDGIGLGVADDIWVKVRIDGKDGWIHSGEDLQAIGLYRAG